MMNTKGRSCILGSLVVTHKDMLLIPLELLKSKRDSVRKAREATLFKKQKPLNLLV